MKPLSLMRQFFLWLALLGLIIAPLAKPPMAMAADMPAAMTSAAVMDGYSGMAMPEGMPCCPDKTPIPDCGKDCPLMATCAAKIFQTPAAGDCLFLFALMAVIVPANDVQLDTLAQAPPPKPPKT